VQHDRGWWLDQEVGGMGVSVAVREMANAVAAMFDDPTVRSVASVLAEMPDWSQQRHLDVWEQRSQDALANVDTKEVPMNLLDEIFEFGAFNLYGAFDVAGTTRNYRQLIETLSKHSVAVSGAQSVTSF
jgi:hypothetical protein